MTSRTILTMCNHRSIDLLDPRVTDIDFDVIAEHLSKVNRFNGATKGLVYNVAEHSVRCADAALRETSDGNLAAYLLCHDMHEAFLGDDTTPKKKALASIIESFGVLKGEIEKAFDQLTDRFDAVIHQAAGMAWPPSDEMRGLIRKYDRVLLATEWRDLMRCDPPYEFDEHPLKHKVHGLWWVNSKREFMQRCHALLPSLRDKVAA